MRAPRGPFSISPDPSSLFLTPALLSTLHKTRYTIDQRQGLTCILGDVGMGKSSVLRLLFSEYVARPEVRAVLIPTPSYHTDFAFVKGLCDEFGLPPRRSLFDQEKELRQFLVQQFNEGKNVVVFIDEAQRLDGKMLEQVRAMLNFETHDAKLVQIVLSAQLELRDRLRDPSKKAIRSRIFAPSMLDPLSLDECASMLEHRSQLAAIPIPFPPPTIQRIYDLTGGVPREILKVAAVAYEMMQLQGASTVSPEMAESVFEEAVLQ